MDCFPLLAKRSAIARFLIASFASISLSSFPFWTDGQAQEVDASIAGSDALAPLALPEHRGRTPESTELTRPKESQPNRDSRMLVQAPRVRSREMLVPGRPGRGLVPLEELDSSSSDLIQPSSTPPEEMGLLPRLPHQIRDGGINFE